MTREEEIIQTAHQKEKEIGFSQFVHDVKGVNSAYGIGFLEGAEWADKHPILETKEVDLEKEIDTLWCLLFIDKTMKRDPTEPHTFIPDPAYTKDGAKISYKLEIDWKVDEIDADFLRKVAKHFFELGINSK